MNPRRHSRLRAHQRKRWISACILSMDGTCYCRICEFADADRLRAFAAGWDGHGGIGAFLRAQDKSQLKSIEGT